MPSQSALFHGEQMYEVNYVASLYLETQKIKTLLQEKSADGSIDQWTHKQLYEYLDSLGFIKIK